MPTPKLLFARFAARAAASPSVVLPPLAGVAEARRRTGRPWPRAAFCGLLLIAAVGSSGCVPQAEVTWRFAAARFNDRLRADLHALQGGDRRTDLDRGFFRDGSDGGLINEIFPLAAADSGGPGFLVLTDCLFVGSERTSSDEIRLSWEVVGKVDRSVEPWGKAFLEGHDEIGLCTTSSPVSRLLFEKPGQPISSTVERGCGHVAGGPSGGSAVAVTLPRDPARWSNVLIECRFGGAWAARLEAHAPDLPGDPDARCPSDHFAGPATTLRVREDGFSCLGEGESVDGCALPCGVEPRGDASYRVVETLVDVADPAAGAHRWLKPNVLFVEGTRALVRPMARDGGTLDLAWQTAVDPPNGEGPVRWGENFSPTVRVESVQILTRDGAGAETVVAPVEGRLTIRIPEPALEGPRTVTCTGKAHGGAGFTFLIHPEDDQTSDCAFELPWLRVLTPTYAVSYLHLEPAVTVPISWEATLEEEDLPAGRQAFIRFLLRAETAAPAVRISPAALDFGEMQQDEWREGTLTLENVGGELLEIQSVGWAPGSANPGDFSVRVAGDPVPMPLPIESDLRSDGITSLRLASDAGEAPILSFAETAAGLRVSLGDPEREGEPQPLTLYGEGVTLVGSLLLRHDPGAVFAPPAAGPPRPFFLPAYAEARPPFLLAPGKRVTIFVQARPGARGQRTAALAVDAVSLVNRTFSQTVVAQLVAQALSGPQLHALPSSLWIKRDSPQELGEPRRHALLENVGPSDLEVQQLDLAGSGASRFTVESSRGLPPFVLGPGESADLVVRYLPECDGAYTLPDHEASLSVASDGGTAEIPLFGQSQGYCEIP